MNDYKTILVLSGGAARGLSHIGVIKALIDKDISVDAICGSSIGALVGACYAKAGTIKELENLILNTDLTGVLKLADFNLALIFRGFVQGQKVKEILKAIIGDVEFKDLSIPLSIVATDAITGEEVVITKGSVVEAVRASISLPVIFMPVKIKNKFLIDGGVVNPVPVNIAKELGAKYIIVSNVIQPPAERRLARTNRGLHAKPEKAIKKFTALARQLNKFINESNSTVNNFQKYVDNLKNKIPATFKGVDADMPNIFDVLTQALYAMQYKIAKANLKQADIVITPDNAHMNTFEFFRGKEAIDIGYQAAKEKLKEVIEKTALIA